MVIMAMYCVVILGRVLTAESDYECTYVRVAVTYSKSEGFGYY